MPKQPQQPDNLNTLSTTRFQFELSKIPNAVYMCQSTSIPSLSITPISIGNPTNPVYTPDNILQFSTLPMTFLVDEDMKNYIELYEWMLNLATGVKLRDFDKLKGEENGDAILSILTNKGNPNVRIKFHNCFPISLSEIPFDTTVQDISPVVCSATFQYDVFEIVQNV